MESPDARHESTRTVSHAFMSRLPRPNRTWLPTPGSVMFTLLVMFVLLGAQTVGAIPARIPLAAAPNPSRGTIAYQGSLTDKDGTPLNGSYRMRFALYPQAASGTELWHEEWTGSEAIQVVNGQFHVLLGSKTLISPATIEGVSTLFLGVQVGLDDEMLPRLQLGSAPFVIAGLTIPAGSITTQQLANGAVTSAKQTIMTYRAEDSTVKTVVGQTITTLSTFTFNNVPAGDTIIMVTLTGIAQNINSVNGEVWMEVGNTRIDRAAMHPLKSGNHTELTLQGTLPNLPGGVLEIRIKASGETTTVKNKFGETNDIRFGRHITLISGL